MKGLKAINDCYHGSVEESGAWGKDGSDVGQPQYLGKFKDVSGEVGEDWGRREVVSSWL